MSFLDPVPAATSADERVLRDAQIDANHPDSILHDFQTLLQFVQETNSRLTGTHLLPLKALRALNERMSHPIELGLTRPQQKSFPHINGLYLLLRASGLTTIDASGKTARLHLDEAMHTQWQALTPTERYFTLLETWILRGDPAIIGEREGLFAFHQSVIRWAMFQRTVWDAGLSGNEDTLDSMRYHPGLRNLALLELFGFVAVEHGAPVEGEGWQIESVRRTPLGDAVFVILNNYFSDPSNLHKLQHTRRISPGELQPLFAPYFPEWQENLDFPEHEFRTGVHIFKVSLQSGSYYWFRNMWRRIAIAGEATLFDFSRAIISAYSFVDDHLHSFTYCTRFSSSEAVYHPYMGEGVSTTEVRVGDVPLRSGDTMEYLFDFGDSWRFDVTLERIDPPDPALDEPKLLEEHGQAPEQYPRYEDDEDYM